MKESLISHQTTVQDKKTVKLKICLKSFGSKHYLNNHQRTVNENEKPFKCEICQKYMKSYSNVKFVKNIKEAKVI